MNYTTLLRDPHNRQVIKAIIKIAFNDYVNYLALVETSGKTPKFVLKVVKTFVFLNQCYALQLGTVISNDNIELATDFVFRQGVITDLIAGLKELGFSID